MNARVLSRLAVLLGVVVMCAALLDGALAVPGARAQPAPAQTTFVPTPTPTNTLLAPTPTPTNSSLPPSPTPTNTSMPTATATPSRAALGTTGVVVAGGNSLSGPTDTIEIFTPRTRSFTPEGTLSSPSADLRGESMGGGNLIMFVGGFNGTVELNDADIYDAIALSAQPTGMMVTGRSNFVIGRLGLTPNVGKILVAGGNTYTGVTNTAEVYDPSSSTFKSTGNMTAARENAAAVVLDNDQVLVCGGDDGTTALSSAEIWNPGTGTFLPTGSLNFPRSLLTATLLRGSGVDGFVLVTGGLDQYGGTLTNAELYDPVKGTWELISNDMTVPRQRHTATRLNDNRVLLTGGNVQFGGLIGQRDTGAVTSAENTAELFDPATLTFTATGSMNHPRYDHTATLLSIQLDGQVLVAGGTDSSGEPTDTAELYDPNSGTFSLTNPMNTPRTEHAAAWAISLCGGTCVPQLNSSNPSGGGLSPIVFLALIVLWTVFGLWRYTRKKIE